MLTHQLAEFLVFLTLFTGVYQLLMIVTKAANRDTVATFSSSKVKVLTLREKLLISVVKPLVEPLANLIPMPYAFQMQLTSELKQVGILFNAKEYYARGLVLASFFIPLPLMVSAVALPPFLFYSTAIIPVVMFFYFTSRHGELLKEKRIAIRRALPSLVATIHNSLGYADTEGEIYGQVNLIGIFATYQSIAHEVLKYDINLLLTEMRSDSVERALMSFRSRVRLPEVTILCDILIGLSKGQPSKTALAALSSDIQVRYREARRDELMRRPGEMKRAIIPLALLTIGTLLTVLVIDLVNSIGFFG